MPITNAAIELASRITNGDILKQTYTTETVVLRCASSFLPLKHSPVTSVSAVTIAGDAITADDANGYTVGKFLLERTHPYTWPAGSVIKVTYSTGWENGEWPVAVDEALQMLDRWLATKPENAMRRITMGETEAWRTDHALSTIPTGVRSLLKTYTRGDHA